MSAAPLLLCRPLLGTFVELSVDGCGTGAVARDLAERAFAEVELVHRTLSVHDPASELNAVNRHAHRGLVPMAPVVAEVLSTAIQVAQASDGAFDPTVGGTLMRHRALPPRVFGLDHRATWRDIEVDGGRVRFHRRLALDFGGIAKGYAVDRACSVLAAAGADYRVDAGGDIRSSRWRDEEVALRLPGASGLAVLAPMRAAAVAGSADPRRGRFAAVRDARHRRVRRRSLSWYVFAERTMIADALTKVVRLHADPAPVLRRFSASALIVDLRGRVAELTNP
jgi:thiamine biosynthesis lipoprotein